MEIVDDNDFMLYKVVLEWGISNVQSCTNKRSKEMSNQIGTMDEATLQR